MKKTKLLLLIIVSALLITGCGNNNEIDKEFKSKSYKIGDIVNIGDEKFYYIGQTDEGNLKLLSMYNLDVGDDLHLYDESSDEVKAIAMAMPDDGATVENSIVRSNLTKSKNTGIQSENSKGETEDKVIERLNTREITYYGIVNFFRDVKYEEDKYDYPPYYTNSEYELLPKYGSSVPAYIYDDNSKIYDYVENYVKYLKKKKVDVSGRLLSYEELISLGCDDYITSRNTDRMNCKESKYDWVYSSSYYIGSVIPDSGRSYCSGNVCENEFKNTFSSLLAVHTKGHYDRVRISSGYSEGNYGVRPLIIYNMHGDKVQDITNSENNNTNEKTSGLKLNKYYVSDVEPNVKEQLNKSKVWLHYLKFINDKEVEINFTITGEDMDIIKTKYETYFEDNKEYIKIYPNKEKNMYFMCASLDKEYALLRIDNGKLQIITDEENYEGIDMSGVRTYAPFDK